MWSIEITAALCLKGPDHVCVGPFLSFHLTLNLILLHKHIDLGFISHIFYYLGKSK